MQSKTGNSSYQVIARKWRPAAFKEVVGQDHVVRTLSNAITSGRIGHAFIFSGPRGVGKTTVARILAKCLNCEQGPIAEPCLECSNCMGITNGSLVDVLEIDGASNNSVDNVRELCESVRYAPANARYKIYIIDEVHMLSTSAFNALLKTLEEPPPHVVFIFATTEPQKIPLTIHSRCQRFDFRRIPFKQINSHLLDIVKKEGIEATPEAVFMISREADGSLRDAQSMLEQVISFSGNKLAEADVMDSLGLMDRGVVFEISEAVLGADGAAALNMVEKIHEFGYDFKKVTAELLEHIRDLVVIKVSGKGLLELPESELERLSVLAESVGLDRLQMLFGLFTGGYGEVLRSTTPRFAFEMMLVRAALLEDLKPIGELIASLEKAGRGSGGKGGGERQLKRSGVNKAASVLSDSSPKGSSGGSKKVLAEPEGTRRTDSVSTEVLVKTPDEAKAEESKSAVAEESKGESKEEGAKTVAGLLQFVKSTDMLIFNRLDASVLTIEGESLTITSKSENVNFLKLVKKDALLKMSRDYFATNIRLNFEAGNVPPSSQGQSEDAPKAAPPAPLPPAYEQEEMASIGNESEQAVSGAGQTSKDTKEDKTPEKAASEPKGDTVLKDALSTLGGKVIDDRRITNV